MRTSVYILHAPEDQLIAVEVRAYFERKGIECWKDQGAVVFEGIAKSQMVVFIYSSKVTGSEFVQQQLRYALTTKKPVIQVSVEKVEPTSTLKELLKGVRHVIVLKGYQRPETVFGMPRYGTPSGRRGIGGEGPPPEPPPPRSSLGDLLYRSGDLDTLVRKEARILETEGARRIKEVAAHRVPEKLITRKTGGFLSRVFNRISRQLENNVDCSIFAPPSVTPGETFLVQVFVHCPDQTAAASEQAKEIDPGAKRHGKKSLEAKIPQGTTLTFHLTMAGLTVVGPLQNLIWRGNAESVQFEVNVPKGFKAGNVIGTVTMSCQKVPVGHIKFNLQIIRAAGRTAKAPKLAGDSARAYQKVFISYASQDRVEVLKRVQMLSRLKIGFFQDVLSLEPGTRWEKEIYRHIDESDLFLLFWSSAAKESKWVLAEVRYAIDRKGGDEQSLPEIIPVIIEGPPPVEPPEELSHLHFNDYLVYLLSEA